MQDSYPQDTYQQSPYQQSPYQQNPYQQNPYQQNPYQQNPYQQNPNAPGAVASLVLGIISVAGSWCYGLLGLVCGIIGLVLGNKARAAYNANPGYYKGAALFGWGIGLSIAGIILSAFWLVIYILVIAGLAGAGIPMVNEFFDI